MPTSPAYLSHYDFKNRADGEIHGEFSNTQMKTLDGRIGAWTADEGVLGRPYVSILDTIQRGLGDRIFFFPYENWTSDPNFWFRKLYDFIEEESKKCSVSYWVDEFCSKRGITTTALKLVISHAFAVLNLNTVEL